MSLKSNILKYSLSLFVFILLVMPMFALAQSSSPGTGIVYECNSGGVIGNCSYADFIMAVRRVVNWLITFTLSFSVVVIVYVGYELMTSGDSSSARTKAKERLWKLAIGIFWVLAAWMVVNLIATTLLNSSVSSVLPIGAQP